MELVEYVCHNPSCQCASSQPYVVKIPRETLMDEQNMATVYCPCCKAILHPEQG